MVKLPIFSNDALRNLKVPVLAIVGGRDVLLNSRQTERRLKQHAPRAQVIYLPQTGHLISGQTETILEFLRTEQPNRGSD
jgi:pimeloyl-ACP methyl ester carboxylesterase